MIFVFQNPFAVFFPGLKSIFSGYKVNNDRYIHRPLEYRTWNSPISFQRLDAGIKITK